MGVCASETPKKEPIKPGSPSARPQSNTNGQKKTEVIVNKSMFLIENKRKITEAYDVLSPPLGSGAYGEVRKAKFKTNGELRAVKIITKASQTKEEQDRLINEVDILRGLDHPNIIRIFEFYQDEKYFYIVTELCTGGELFDKIVESKNFSEKKACEVIQQVLSAIAYCHSNKIVHRDLKPENLLLDSTKADATIKVIDFGLSRVFEPQRKMRHKLGTVYYIAPEVLKQQYDEKCDVWSCGVITYIMLSGYPPFNGQTDDLIIKKIEKGEFNFSGKVWGSITEGAKAFITKMLQYNSDTRYSAQQALADPWMTNQLDNRDLGQQPLYQDAFSNLKTFRAGQKLAQATYMFIVGYLTTKEEKEDLMRTFKAFDKNNDGYLTQDELVEGYTKVYGAKDAETMAKKIMQEVDTNKSGKVDYTEFVVAAMNKQTLNSKEKLEKAFEAFDQDGNGFITVEELKKVLDEKSQVSDDAWTQIIREVDANGDGKISLKEFKDMMTKTLITN